MADQIAVSNNKLYSEVGRAFDHLTRRRHAGLQASALHLLARTTEIRAHRPMKSWLTWLRPRALNVVTLVLPIAICLALILATGPQSQYYVMSLLNSDVPSVYGSAYKAHS